MQENMEEESCSCRPGCGACCIAPSISSPIPAMPQGKPAGIRCSQLTDANRCRLFGQQERPAVCSRLRPTVEMCGADAGAAMHYLTLLERETQPDFQDQGYQEQQPAHPDLPVAKT